MGQATCRKGARLSAMECMTCQALRGDVVLTNGPRIELDHCWHVEHCHPVETLGWLVLVLRRLAARFTSCPTPRRQPSATG